MVESRQKTRVELWAPIETALAAGMTALRSVPDRFSALMEGRFKDDGGQSLAAGPGGIFRNRRGHVFMA